MADDLVPGTLVLKQGQRFRQGYRWKVAGVARDLSLYSFRAQARRKEDRSSALLVDFTTYIQRDLDDNTVIWIDVPATVTAAVDAKHAPAGGEARWDLFLWPTGDQASARLLVEGPFEVNPSTTDMEQPA